MKQMKRNKCCTLARLSVALCLTSGSIVALTIIAINARERKTFLICLFLCFLIVFLIIFCFIFSTLPPFHSLSSYFQQDKVVFTVFFILPHSELNVNFYSFSHNPSHKLSPPSLQKIHPPSNTDRRYSFIKSKKRKLIYFSLSFSHDVIQFKQFRFLSSFYATTINNVFLS